MSISLFFELETIVGKDTMMLLCEQYMFHCAIDASETRDCGSDNSGIYPQRWMKTPTRVQRQGSASPPGAPKKFNFPLAYPSPPTIKRFPQNILANLQEPFTPSEEQSLIQ